MGRLLHPEPVLTPEIEIEAGLRNVVSAIASTLRPGAMVACPVLRAILLPCTMPLPAAALLHPSPLLLPRDCLLLAYAAVAVVARACCPLLLLRPLLLSLLGPLLLGWAACACCCCC